MAGAMQLLYVLFLEVSVCIDASYVVYISLLSILLKSEHTRMLTSMFYNGFKLSDNILALLGSCCCTKKNAAKTMGFGRIRNDM